MLNMEEDGEATAIDISKIRLEPMAESKYLYDAKTVAEWKKNCLTNNAVEAAHDADFLSALRNRMKYSVAAALDQKLKLDD